MGLGKFKQTGIRSAGREYDPAGDLPLPKLLEDFVNLCQRSRGRLASDFSCRTQGQDFLQVLPRADGGSLDVHFRCRHHDWRKADGL